MVYHLVEEVRIGEQQVCQSSMHVYMSVGLRLIKLVHGRTQVTSSVT